MVGSTIFGIQGQSWLTSASTSTSMSISSLRVHLGDGDQHVILERGIILAQVVAAEDAVFEQVGVDLSDGRGTAQRKFVEEGLGEAQAHSQGSC